MDTETINAIGNLMIVGPIYTVIAVFFAFVAGYTGYMMVQAWKESKLQIIITLLVIAWFVVAGFLRVYQ